MDEGLQLARERAEFSERFTKRPDKGERVELVLMGQRERVKMSVMELFASLHLSGLFYRTTGEPAELVDVVLWGERSFGVKLSNYTSLKRNLLARKKTVTVFLDQLRDVLLKEAEGAAR